MSLHSRSDAYPLYRLRTDTTFINFEFWDTLPSRDAEGRYCNAIAQRLVGALGGKKCLYSRSTYDEATFWSIYDGEAYETLKRRCDPAGRYPGLYGKAVGARPAVSVAS